MRLSSVLPPLPIGRINSDCRGRLASVRGHVLKVVPPRCQVLEGDFQCLKCQVATRRKFENGLYTVPPICGVVKPGQEGQNKEKASKCR